MTKSLLLWVGLVSMLLMRGYARDLDFGDAPSPPYPTLLPDGARHGVSSLHLGAGVDGESNGQPVDRDGADEAGIGIPPLRLGSTVELVITASMPGLLNAWLDFDGTPGWGPAEQVFTNVPVEAGTHVRPLTLPAGAVAGPSWFRFRLSSAAGLGPGDAAPDGEVEDYRVRLLCPVDPRPMMFVLDYHADPMGGPASTQAVTFSNWVNASHWLLDQTEPRGAKLSFLTVGGFAEWAREVSDLGYPLMQRLYASGAQLGTHSHSEHRLDLHDWPDLGRSPSLLELTNAWNDHLNMVDGLVAEALGFAASEDIRRVNFVRGSHAPTNHQDRLDFLTMSGYTQHQQGLEETYYGHFGHFAWNPYRPSGTNFLVHDPTGPVVLAPFGPVLGKNERHSSPAVLDMRPPAVKARMLLEVLNWLHDRRVAGTERIWVNGWGQHCTDVITGGVSRAHFTPMLDWLNEHFIGRPVGGAVAAAWASMGEVGEAYRQWEATHPGETSFSYASTNTNWNRYQYLRPAAAYLASALYLSNLPPVGPVRWHAVAVTAGRDGLLPFTAYVAYTTNGVPLDADLSPHLAASRIAAVSPVSGAASEVPATAVPIPSIGTILVPTEYLMGLRFDFGDAPEGYPVLLAENGARHAPSALRLGLQLDTEWDGRASAYADGDDVATLPDDEDGVTWPPGLTAGRTNAVVVHVTGATRAALDVWFDWNLDLDWDDPGEHFSLSVVGGTNLWNLPVPAEAAIGQTACRFRLSTAGTPWPTHAAPDGEVEDYRVPIRRLSAEAVRVRNPTSGLDLYCHIHRPASLAPGGVYPGIVLVPGGVDAGGSFDDGDRAQGYADLGFIVMHFDPDGRGASTADGTYTREDYCGHLHQDGLRAVLQHLRDLPETDDLNLGLVSGSFGITMASGFLARYPGEPPVKFLLDWEGPADRSDTADSAGRPGHVPYPLWDDASWSEREAAGFISSFAGYYLRVQTEIDHVQPDNEHAVRLVNLATDTSYGGLGRCLWTRVNSAGGRASNAVNAAYSPASPPNWIAEGISTDSLLRDYLLELAALPPLRLDFGNAPAPYPTTLASGGARHNVASGLRLGAAVDWETTGPDPAPADEDGVSMAGPLVPGTDTVLRVNASREGWLDAFLDWNRDGDWDDPAERVTPPSGSPLVPGMNFVPMRVPPGIATGIAWARFRLSEVGGLGPIGSAPAGEVEDYGFLVAAMPIALSGGIESSALGSASLSVVSNRLQVLNLGSGGHDGIRVHLKERSGAVRISFASLPLERSDARVQINLGTDLQVGLQTNASMLAIQRVGDGLTVAGDFSPLGVPAVRVEAIRDGVFVAGKTVSSSSLTGLVTTAESLDLPDLRGTTFRTDQPGGGLACTLKFGGVAQVAFAGLSPIDADEVRFLALDPRRRVDGLAWLEVKASSMSGFTVDNVVIEAPTLNLQINRRGRQGVLRGSHSDALMERADTVRGAWTPVPTGSDGLPVDFSEGPETGRFYRLRQVETRLELARMLRQSELVFEGTVTAVEYRDSTPPENRGPGVPHTFVTLAVDKVFKGSTPADRLTLRFAGGMGTDQRLLRIKSSTLFDVGERSILLVRGNERFACPLVRWAGGRFRLVDGHVYTEGGCELVSAADGQFEVGAWRELTEVRENDVAGHLLERVRSPEETEEGLPVTAPRGQRLSETEFREFLAELIRRIHSQEELRDLAPVASADATQAFSVPDPASRKSR